MARPLKYDAAMPRDRATMARQAREQLKARGGRLLSIQLESEAVQDLEAIRLEGESDASVIARCLRRCANPDF